MYNCSKKIIQIIEDNPVNQKLISSMLVKVGYTTQLAKNGTEGLKQIAAKRPDMILLDVILPGMDGFETCRRIKKDTLLQDIPIIFMTSLGHLKDKVRGFQVGGVDYIIKPFQNEEVLARIATQLAIQQLNRDLLDKNKKLEQALTEIRTLQGIIPICSCCKKIRDDTGYWQQVEQYLGTQTGARFSHSYCPKCLEAAKKSY
ncbi:MAG: response regulator [Desulfobulbus propionicus]|nr:MAG: response regulator [Desulfobulbus propionicus]